MSNCWGGPCVGRLAGAICDMWVPVGASLARVTSGLTRPPKPSL